MIASDWPPIDGLPECLVMWTIHDRPLDFPRFFVVRRCFCVPWQPGFPGLDASGVTHDVVPRLANSLAEARALVPWGLYRQPRQEGDDPFIVESWF